MLSAKELPMPLPNPTTRPRKNTENKNITSRVIILEEHMLQVDQDLSEHKDVKGQMNILDERTKRMEVTANKNFNAIYGEPDSPGILTRLSAVETTTTDIKKALEKVLWAVIIGGGGLFIEQLVSLILSHGTR